MRAARAKRRQLEAHAAAAKADDPKMTIVCDGVMCCVGLQECIKLRFSMKLSYPKFLTPYCRANTLFPSKPNTEMKS
jgi:hypothetical protein